MFIMELSKRHDCDKKISIIINDSNNKRGLFALVALVFE